MDSTKLSQYKSINKSNGTQVFTKFLNGNKYLTLKNVFIIFVVLVILIFIIAISAFNIVARSSINDELQSSVQHKKSQSKNNNSSSFKQFLESSPDLMQYHFYNSTTDLLKHKLPNMGRFFPASFATPLAIRGRKVTCNPRSAPFPITEFYPLPTWVCENISIDGHRLPYTDHIKGLSDGGKFKSNNMYFPGLSSSGDTEICGDTSIRRCDLFSLCNEMLMAIRPLIIPSVQASVVQIPDASCGLAPNARILLVNNASYNEPSNLFWLTEQIKYKKMRGYIITLRCSFSGLKS